MEKATAPTTKSVSTRIDTAAVYDHYLHVISNLQSDDTICKSLELYGIKSLPDLLDMDKDDIKALEYIDNSGNNTPLHRGGQGRVRVMQAYFRYLREEGIDDILSLAHEDFNDFRMDIYDPNSLPTPSSKVKKLHNEGTTRSNGTTPTIGFGESKQCRDYGILGLGVGSTIGQPDTEPTTLDESNCCVMAYDIECEFAGPHLSSYQSPILCVSLVCTCGYKHIVTRCDLLGMDCNYTVKVTNQDIAVEVIRQMKQHSPAFTVGHNVYTFDNTVLAKALPRQHAYRSYFDTVQKSDTKSSTTIGLIMAIPGINNVDTYKYIYHSMYHRFKVFSLDQICKALELPVQKMYSHNLRFCKDWYSSCFTNRLEMARYNIVDCEATLAVCKRLDMINQIVALCYGANAWIRDVLLYNTGAMSLSSMCSVAWKHGYKYNWTRCDWVPNTFVGGQVLFTGNKVERDVAIVDFTSMYPSIIRDGGISPECIDYIDLDTRLEPRFNYLICLCHSDYNRSTLELNIGATVLGVNDRLDTDATGNVLIGEEYRHLLCQFEDATPICSSYVDSLLMDVSAQDRTLQDIPKRRCITWACTKPSHHNGLNWYATRCQQLARCAQKTRDDNRYVFSADKVTWKDGMVDWVTSPLDSTMMFVTDSYIARFCPGPRVCAEACETLMNNRQGYKQLMRRKRDPTRQAVYNRTQYALKICANSMYGAMSFRHYNSYSPRCGTSVTGSGRWSLSVSAAVVSGLGFEVVYGDTDSVMYTLDFDGSRSDLIHLCAKNILDSYTDLTTTDLMEFISGNERAFVCSDKHLLPISNVVVKVLNKIMSYTCFGHLRVEQQETESTAPRNYKSIVFPSFMITSKKHYVDMKRDGELYTKGMNYIRRSGCKMLNFSFIPGNANPADVLSKHWSNHKVWPMLQPLMFWQGDTLDIPDSKNANTS